MSDPGEERGETSSNEAEVHDSTSKDDSSRHSDNDESEEAWMVLIPALFTYENEGTRSVAFMADSMEDLMNLTKKKELITRRNSRGWLPLHKAVFFDSYKCTEFFLQHYPLGVNICSIDGESPLLMGCKVHANIKIIHLLLHNKANVNLSDLSGYSPLHVACMKNNFALVELLVNHGADVNAQARDLTTPLHKLLEQENADIKILEYLYKCGADIRVKDLHGYIPLHVASENKNVYAVRIMLDWSVDVNSLAADGTSALMLAAKSGSLDLVDMLLRDGADPNITNYANLLAVHYAARGDHGDVMKYLLELTNHDYICSTANLLLNFIITGNSFRCLDILLTNNINDRNLFCDTYATNFTHCVDGFYDSYTELSMISYLFQEKNAYFDEDSEKLLDILLEKGCPVNSTSHSCMPPLVAAIKYLRIEKPRLLSCIYKLISRGADVNFHRPDVPEALLNACIFQTSDVALMLFQESNFATPDSLLCHCLKYKSLSTLAPEVVFLFLKLGVSLPSSVQLLRKSLSDTLPHSGVSVPNIYSLQQLCRVAIRHMFYSKYKEYHVDDIMAFLGLPIPMQHYLRYRRM